MFNEKIYLLDAIKIEKRLLHPIVSLKVIMLDDIYFSLDYELLAFKIIEEDKTYYASLNLSDEQLDDIKKN
jgi:hypothetical protein